jgi:predicted RNA-binding protein with PUA-like domain
LPGAGHCRHRQNYQAAYPDPTALDPKAIIRPKATPEKNAWSAIDVAHVETFARVLKLDYLKQQTALAELPLVQKGSRLSVMPVTAEQWAVVLDCAENSPVTVLPEKGLGLALI